MPFANDQCTAAEAAVIGSGMCGITTAFHLAAKNAGKVRPLIVHLFEKESEVGGLGYRNMPVPLIMNIPISRVSVFVDPLGGNHLLRWLQTTDRSAWPDDIRNRWGQVDFTEDDFLPRSIYRMYLQDTLNTLLFMAGVRNAVVLVENANLVNETPVNGRTELQLETEQGTRYLQVDRVALTTGNLPPEENPLGLEDDVLGHPAYVGAMLKGLDRLINTPKGKRVLVLGSGLSGMDCLRLRLAAQERTPGGRNDVITVMSRHGYMHDPYPEGYQPNPFTAHSILSPADVPSNYDDAERLLQDTINHGLSLGHNTEEILSAIAATFIVGIFNNLPKDDAVRFIRNNIAYLNAARIGAPSDMDDVIATSNTTVRAGMVENIRPSRKQPERLTVTSTEPDGTSHTEEYDMVVSAVGTGYRYDESTPGIWGGLIRDGKARPHWTGLGVDVDVKNGSYRVRDANGNLSDYMFAAGPMVMGSYAEVTGEIQQAQAIPQLRLQCAAMADSLMKSLETAVGVPVERFYELMRQSPTYQSTLGLLENMLEGVVDENSRAEIAPRLLSSLAYIINAMDVPQTDDTPLWEMAELELENGTRINLAHLVGLAMHSLKEATHCTPYATVAAVSV